VRADPVDGAFVLHLVVDGDRQDSVLPSVWPEMVGNTEGAVVSG
jgi:hypothetical protein